MTAELEARVSALRAELRNTREHFRLRLEALEAKHEAIFEALLPGWLAGMSAELAELTETIGERSESCDD